MLSIFSCPKHFRGHFGVIQRNAIRSWTRLSPRPEIFLAGDDDGVQDICRELGLRHIPAIRRNAHGTPLLSSIYEEARKAATSDYLCFVNSDIIFLRDLEPVLARIDVPRFLLAGRRWDLDIEQEIGFEGDWRTALRARAFREGRLHGYSGIDYILFRRDYRHEMPDFAIGRPGWDNWFLYNAKRHGLRIIDATAALPIVHQNHDYSHSRFGAAKRVEGPELTANYELAGGYANLRTLRDADFELDEAGNLVGVGIARRLYQYLSATEIGASMLAWRRSRLGKGS